MDHGEGPILGLRLKNYIQARSWLLCVRKKINLLSSFFIVKTENISKEQLSNKHVKKLEKKTI
jgi:hypothetical protein